MKTDLIDIHKSYGRTEALKGACLSIHEGEVHCILGENGAGKTSLMKILSGFTRKASGKIIVNGRETDFKTQADAAKAGIGMIHQEPLDFPQLTVLDNFILGQKNGLFSSRLKNRKKLSEICRKFNFSLDQKKQTGQLQMSERHQLELAGLIASGTETIILDEVICGIPDVRHNTTVSAIRQLADEGKSIVIVSARLDKNIEMICDRITILKSGKTAAEFSKPFSTPEITALMSDELTAFPARTHGIPFESILEIIDFHAEGVRTGLKECNMSVSKGEIIALAGHKDNGQELFLRAVAGIRKISQGEIMFDEKILTGRPVSDFREAGICFVPDLNKSESLVPGMTVEDHFILSNDHESFIAWRMPARQSAAEMAERFQINAEPETPVESLSKEDRLKLLLALLPEEPKIILIENPSKWLDPASANQMWSFLADHASDHGTVIFFSSSDIDEIHNISTRTVLFSEGKIIMDMPSKAVTEGMIARALEGHSN